MNFPGCLEMELEGEKNEAKVLLKINKNKEEKTWQEEIIQIPALPCLVLLFVIKQ